MLRPLSSSKEKSPMQIKKYTDYGLRILMYLATQDEGQLTTIRDICDAYDIPKNHVNKIIHHLGKLELITTKRGKNGGFSLAKSPSDIRLDRFIREMEGDTPWVNCHSPFCKIVPVCKLKDILAEGKAQFYAHLANFTLASLVVNRTELIDVFQSET